MDKKTKRIKKKIPKQKQKQKQKVIQKVNVSVSSSGGSGGSTMPSNYPSHQMMPNFINSNEQEKNIIKSLVDLLNKPQTISRQPQQVFNIPQPNDSFNIPQSDTSFSTKYQPQFIYKHPIIDLSPDNSNLDLLGRVDQKDIKKVQPRVMHKHPIIDLQEDTSNLNLMERVEQSQNDNEDELNIPFELQEEFTPEKGEILILPTNEKDRLEQEIEYMKVQYKNIDGRKRGSLQREINKKIGQLKEIKEAEENVGNYGNYGEQINIGPIATTANPLRAGNSWITKK